MIEIAVITVPTIYVGQKMYEYITSQSSIVQLSIEILYMPKANGSMKGMMPIINRMFHRIDFFMGFSFGINIQQIGKCLLLNPHLLFYLLQFLFELRISQILICAPLLYHTPIRIVGVLLYALKQYREPDI